MVNKTKRVSVIQAGSDPFDTPATIDKFADWLAGAKAAGSELAVFPEAFIGGYPKGVDFGVRVGSRDAAGRELFRLYSDNAVELGTPEFDALSEAVVASGIAVIVGVIERKGATLYCSTFAFEKDGSLLGVHRKLVPTAMERLIWGQGDGSDLPIMESSAGRLVSAICWENYMPLLRSFYYDSNPDFYCVSTVDDRPVWLPTMQMIALESRSFVLSACQYLERGMIGLGDDQFDAVQGNRADTVLINGGSCIIAPDGEVLAGPVFGEEAILTAEVDLNDRMRGKFDMDVAGHYARPDVFELKANIGEQMNVREE
ncbi:carbon-nitrogen hydrolase family protein [Parasphingorhabdus halotolerans]|uniref:Carbon-nitrogen hydrolase family protein n=1 Tax=Parasphingorhabdus halotolerans TaxID=2725558 RepID=A0A6H2DQA2_9SPHN|nr:carbon-nitrogen hydrolase family protein [Parasphingorhabdus halotolerans]QJB69941.1 carbon-nitrogen hydrolase family protein [Parasphingorhabdus halotolerans]